MRKNLFHIPSGTHVFVDANIFLFALISQGHFGGICYDFLNHIKKGKFVGYTSSIVVAEVTHRIMLKEAQNDDPKTTVEYLQKHPEKVRLLKKHLTVASNIRQFNVDVLSVSVFDLHRAKEVRRDYGLMTNDSVIVGVMRGEKLCHLATYDAGFARVPDIHVWMPQGNK